MLAESIRITLVALFFLWKCEEGVLADGLSFEALLAAAIATILLRLPGEGFCLVRNSTDLWIIRPNLLNFRSRELPSAPKSAPKLLLSFCYRSALVLLSFHKPFI